MGNIWEVTGKYGEDGEDNKDGEDGEHREDKEDGDGEDGEDGEDREVREDGEDGQDRKDGEYKDKNLTTPRGGVLTAIPYATMPFRFNIKQVLLKLF